MDDRSGLQLLMQEIYLSIEKHQPPRSIQPWVGAMSNRQRAVMFCNWGVKAGMDREWVAGKTM